MIRSIVCTIVILTGFTALSQSRTSSPYSFFGIGQQTFRGTVENRSMGGMRTHLDSIHVNLRNPAAYGKLRLTTFSIGSVHTETWASTATQNETYESTSIEYVSIGIPLSKKLGMGFGLVPFKSVGYEIGERTDDFYTNFTGEGSINRAYFGLGYEFNKNFSLGGELRYNFGREINSSSVALSNVQYGTNEVNESDFSGLSFNFGLHYQAMVSERLEIQASATYTPESKITAVGTRDSSLFLLNGDFTESLFNTRSSDIASEKLDLPSDFTLGATIGLPRKWSLGAEFSLQQASDFSSRNIIPDNTRFTDAASYRVGGYYIPDYNSISSYWNRVVYRGGIRYEETGLNLNGSDINEFGISFGMSLPVGRTSAFSNATFGLEYGQRGTTDNNLIKEDFFSISFGLSLNDKWFQKRKYN